MMGPTFRLDRMIVYGRSAEYAEISSSSIPPSRGKGKRSIFNLHEPPYHPILVVIKCSRMGHFSERLPASLKTGKLLRT